MQIKIAVLKIEWESKLYWWVRQFARSYVKMRVDRQKETMHMG